MSGENFKFFDERIVKRRLFKTFAKLNGKDTSSASFGILRDHKSCLLIWIQNFDYRIVANLEKYFWKVLVWFLHAVKNVTFLCFTFSFIRFSGVLCQKSYEKTTFFITEIGISHKLLLSCKNLRSTNFQQRRKGPLKFLGNLHRNHILSAISGKFLDDEFCTWLKI